MNKDLKYMPIDNKASVINNNGTPFRNNAIKKMEGSALFNHGNPNTPHPKKVAGTTAGGSARTTDGDYNYADGSQISINQNTGAYKPSAKGIEIAKNRTGYFDTDPEGIKRSTPYTGKLLRGGNNNSMITGIQNPDGSKTRFSAFDENKPKSSVKATQKLYNNFLKTRDSHNKNAEFIQNSIRKVAGYTGPTRRPGSSVKK